jgi:hypothetical protein
VFTIEDGRTLRQRTCADRYSEPAHQALAGTSSEDMPHRSDDLVGSLGLFCMWGQTFENRSVRIRRWQPAFRQRQRPWRERDLVSPPVAVDRWTIAHVFTPSPSKHTTALLHFLGFRTFLHVGDGHLVAN